MRRFLVSPGAEPAMGLIGLAAAFMAIGLSIVALDDNQEANWAAWTCFGLAGATLVLFVGSLVTVLMDTREREGQLKEITAFIQEAVALGNKIAKGEGGDDPRESVRLWAEVRVWPWFEKNMPAYLGDAQFAMTPPGSAFVYGENLSHAQNKALGELQHFIATLREIGRDIRR
jgi:hypothetical protein